jgi:hypothetical protein
MSSIGADFQEAFVLIFAPAVSLILAFGLAGTVIIAIIRVVVMAITPRARRLFVKPEWGTDERR